MGAASAHPGPVRATDATGPFRTIALLPDADAVAQNAVPGTSGRCTVARVGSTRSAPITGVGDPVKLAAALLTIAQEEPPRWRFIAGADSIGGTEQKVAELQADIDLNRERFISLDITE